MGILLAAATTPASFMPIFICFRSLIRMGTLLLLCEDDEGVAVASMFSPIELRGFFATCWLMCAHAAAAPLAGDAAGDSRLFPDVGVLARLLVAVLLARYTRSFSDSGCGCALEMISAPAVQLPRGTLHGGDDFVHARGSRLLKDVHTKRVEDILGAPGANEAVVPSFKLPVELVHDTAGEFSRNSAGEHRSEGRLGRSQVPSSERLDAEELSLGKRVAYFDRAHHGEGAPHGPRVRVC